MSDTFDYIDAPFDDAPEEQLPPEGMYPLFIRDIEKGVTKDSNRRKVTCYIDIEATDANGRPYQGVFHVLTFPSEDDWTEDSRKAKQMLLFIKRFCALFEIKLGGQTKFDPEALRGARGQGHVIQREYEGNVSPSLRLARLKE